MQCRIYTTYAFIENMHISGTLDNYIPQSLIKDPGNKCFFPAWSFAHYHSLLSLNVKNGKRLFIHRESRWQQPSLKTVQNGNRLGTIRKKRRLSFHKIKLDGNTFTSKRQQETMTCKSNTELDIFVNKAEKKETVR